MIKKTLISRLTGVLRYFEEWDSLKQCNSKNVQLFNGKFTIAVRKMQGQAWAMTILVFNLLDTSYLLQSSNSLI